MANAVAPEKGPSLGTRIIEFYHGVMAEMRKVTWPDMAQVRSATGPDATASASSGSAMTCTRCPAA